MSDLKARFWVDALRWRAESAGASVYVDRKGDPDAGVVLVKVLLPQRLAQLYVPVRDMEGERLWTQPLGPEPVDEMSVTAYLQRRTDRDPDLWVVEIDDPHGRHFLNEPIEKI
ncbi:DUF1491 family protein [Maricaulaceae bacterium EIL42A08]|nr:DUF1491 family protein [Maricaulaceae bacterium EIL42A08]